jgi:hypothetical protein
MQKELSVVKSKLDSDILQYGESLNMLQEKVNV